jgi:hypothetical protein
MILDAAGGDPLLAQEVEQRLGAIPQPLLGAVMAAAKGSPTRALEIKQGLNARWWERWLAFIDAKSKAQGHADQF